MKSGTWLRSTPYRCWTFVTFDDQKDPKRAIAGMEKMAQEGIHYVVGPNVDDGAAAVRPVAEKSGSIYFPYASRKNSTPSLPPTRSSAWWRTINRLPPSIST